MKDYNRLKIAALEKIARLIKTASTDDLVDGVRGILSAPMVKNASDAQQSRRLAEESVCYSFFSGCNSELSLNGDHEHFFQNVFMKVASSIASDVDEFDGFDFSKNIIQSFIERNSESAEQGLTFKDQDHEKIASDDLKLDSSLAEAINVLEEAGLLDN